MLNLLAFNNAVYLEYCTSNDLNVLDNNIEDAVNGIVDIGSWSYIARNTLTGLSDSGCGITLDDYSGIVKHNVVTNYKSSVFSLLSAPYLYKNSFQLASDVNLDFESYSTPLLQPIESGVLKYWYGGDNIINISDDGVGVNLLEDSYPLLKDGYNKFYLNAADYFISGEVPEEFEDSIEVRNNYWSTTLTSGKFNISNTTVKYNPTEDGSLGNRPHNTTILMSIGFGLWDTINIHDAGDNSSPDLFLTASNKLIDGNYSEAIEDFKDIVEQKDSNFTNLSLKKIFHCYERSNFFNSNFSEAKSFFTGIFLDSNYNEISRSLANDLNLKVMLHNSEYTLVKEKYSSLYLNNTSNSLGFHALINKTILDNLSIVDTTDNLSSSAEFGDLNDHKKTMFALLNSNSVLNNRSEINTSALVKDYKLEQNYPNPFNPTTYIYYELPVSGMVSLKVYDLLGREMLSIVNEVKDAGKYKVAFDGSNFASGVYFYRIFSQNFVQTKRMVLIK